MQLIRKAATYLVSVALAISAPAQLALACQEEAMLVFDASGSMQLSQSGLSKIDIARAAAGDVLPELTRKRPTGLVTYGGEPGESCKAITMRLPPMVESGELIIGELLALQPSGSTPLTEAVWTAATALRQSGNPGTIVLVTDGRENCGYNACVFGQQMAMAAKQLKVHVIGFFLNSGAETNVACLARATGGTYTSVNGLEELKAALKKTLACPRIS